MVSEDPFNYLKTIAEEYFRKLKKLMLEGKNLVRVRRITETGNITLEMDLRGDEKKK